MKKNTKFFSALWVLLMPLVFSPEGCAQVHSFDINALVKEMFPWQEEGRAKKSDVLILKEELDMMIYRVSRADDTHAFSKMLDETDVGAARGVPLENMPSSHRSKNVLLEELRYLNAFDENADMPEKMFCGRIRQIERLKEKYYDDFSAEALAYIFQPLEFLTELRKTKETREDKENKKRYDMHIKKNSSRWGITF